MPDVNIDTLSLEVSANANSADTALDRLCNSLLSLDSALSRAGTVGLGNFERTINTAIDSLNRLAEKAKTPINLNIQANSGDQLTRMKDSLEQALSNTRVDTSKIASSLANEFNITGKKATQEIDAQLQSIIEHFVDTFDGKAVKLADSALGNLTETIAQNAKISQGELHGTLEGIKEDYEDFYNYFKNKKIYISDNLKAGMGKGYFNELLKSNLSMITRDAKKGTDLNGVWDELYGYFPTLINRDTVIDEEQVLEVLQKINEIRSQIKPISVQTLFGNDYETAIQKIRESVLGAINEAKNTLNEEANKLYKMPQGSKIDLDIQINEDKIVRDIESAIRKASNVKYTPLSIDLSVDTAKISSMLSDAFKGLDIVNFAGMATGLNELTGALRIFAGTTKTADFTRIATGLNKLSTIDVQGVSNASAAIGTLTANLSQLGTISFDSAGIINIANAIAQLGRKTVTQAAANIPVLTTALTGLVSGLNGLQTISFDLTGLSELVSSISRLGGKAAAAAIPNIQSLGTALVGLMSSLASAPVVSQNVIDMANSLAQLASNGSRVSSASSGLISGINGIGTSSSKAKKHIFSLASAIGKFYATYWLIIRSIGLFKKAIDISSDLTEVQNIVDVTFGDMADKVDELSKHSIQDFGMSELTAKKISSRFQAMGVAMGFGQEKMSDMSIELTKLAADMASFYNVEQDVVAEDLEAVFTGQTRPLMLAA